MIYLHSLTSVMKLVLILVCVLLSANLLAQQEQVLNVKDIPTSVQGTLMKQFPDLNTTTAMRNAVKWKKDHGGYGASFTYQGNKMSASFDGSGLLKETKRVTIKENFPQAVLRTMKAQFPHVKFTGFSELTFAGGAVSYEAVSRPNAYLFSPDGIFIRKQKN